MASEKYRLLYFNARGRAEILRYIFLYANVDYEDERFTFEEWPEVKAKLPLQKVPVLYVNEQPIADSGSSVRYLARKFGLAGKNEIEIAQADVVMEAVRDVFFYCAMFIIEKDEAKKAQKRAFVYEEKIPTFLDNVEKVLKANGGKYFVGNEFSYADLAVANGLEEFIAFSPDPSLMEKHELLQALMDRVFSIPAIKEWRDSRPQSPF